MDSLTWGSHVNKSFLEIIDDVYQNDKIIHLFRRDFESQQNNQTKNINQYSHQNNKAQLLILNDPYFTKKQLYYISLPYFEVLFCE